MITHRLRGLINLHAVASTAIMGAFFLFCVLGTRYQPWVELLPEVDLGRYLLAVVVGMMIGSRFITVYGARFHRLSWVDSASLSLRQIVVVALVVFTVIVATKDQRVSRLFLASYLALGGVVLLLTNQILPRILAKIAFSGHHRLPTLFIGKSRARSRLEQWLAEKEHLGIRPVGFLSDEADPLTREGGSEGTRFLGPMNALAQVIEDKGVGQVILLEMPATSAETDRILETCQAAGCRLLIHYNIEDRISVPLLPVVEDGHYFFTTHEEPLEDPLNRALKRLFDVAVSLPVVLFVLPPLYLLVWTIQRWQSPGPLLFSRVRGGHRGTEFIMLKFRSMRSEVPDARREAKQASPGDSRIYPFGRFLRKTSLDEFPQFYNVLRGDMSIVGPRPHLPQHDEEFSRIAKTYRSRQLVKPGITGLAQTKGYRGEITDPAVLHQRVALDVYYITHWSIWLDIEITLKTARHVFAPPKSAV
jgi:exopolysaccharide biosynthesis polyprenyl glycosylphosphotransferase